MENVRVVMCEVGIKPYVKFIDIIELVDNLDKGRVLSINELEDVVIISLFRNQISSEMNRLGLKGTFYFINGEQPILSSLREDQIERIEQILNESVEK